MKIVEKNPNFTTVEFSADEYDAFVQILKMKSLHKDYKGGK